MKPKLPQWQQLYRAMQKGRRLTALDCFKLCGTLNAHKRINDGEQSTGVPVRRGWRFVKKKRIREYYL